MPNLIPTRTAPIERFQPAVRPRPLDRQNSRSLARLEQQTLVRIAALSADELVRTEALHHIDRLTREALSGHVMLRQWADTLACGDPLVAEECRFFLDASRLAKGEILADTVSNFCRNGQRW